MIHDAEAIANPEGADVPSASASGRYPVPSKYARGQSCAVERAPSAIGPPAGEIPFFLGRKACAESRRICLRVMPRHACHGT